MKNMNIEEKLKQSHSNPKTDIADQVMEKIEIENIKMRSKFYFQLKNFFLCFIFILILIILAFLINLVLYAIKESYTLEYLDFGWQGVSVFLQNLPYFLFVVLAFLFAAAFRLMSKFEISYKKPFAIFIVVIIAGTSMSGTAIFASDFNETVQQKVDEEELKAPIVSPITKKIYKRYGPGMVKKNGFIAVVNKPPAPERRDFVAKVPQGKLIRVRLTPKCKIISKENLATGDIVVLLGKPIVDFHAKGIKVIENKQKAVEMIKKLRARKINLKFRKRESLGDYKDFPVDPEMKKEFMENMGGFLQSEQDIRQANIIIEK